ncbi:Rpn family recombination-promoting nuclease/putative transposase [Microcoleus sp. herbarium19]|uniref:Rpn family recombination-promoting nuclease/putative transposase n=1 Tax=unclassified Microcoleus TaxID=2642155 RepID=UPI002FCFA01D
MSFIDPRTDFAFKKIFASAESKPILISFLNGMIYQGNPAIQDVQIIDPDLARTVIGLKDTYLDVKATLDNGTSAIVEIQVLNIKTFQKQIAYNAAKAFANQLMTGKGYLQLDPVIALTITDFTLFENTNKVISRFSLKEKEEHFDYIFPVITMIFVELPKFNKSLAELESLADKWIYFIKEAPSLEMVPESLKTNSEIQQAFNIANSRNLSIEELDKFERQLFYLQDQQRFREDAFKEGFEQGLQQRMQRKSNLVIRLLTQKLGILDESIQAGVLQLSSEQLDSLTECSFDFDTVDNLVNWLEKRNDQRFDSR